MALLQIRSENKFRLQSALISSHYESVCNEIDFTFYALTIKPGIHLTLFKHTHNFKAFEYGISRFHRLETKGWLNQSLNLAVITLNNVVEIF